MNLGEAWVRVALDDKGYKKGLDGLEGYTRQKAATLGTVFKGAFGFALGLGLVQGFRSITGAVTDFINTAARTETLNVAMDAVARSSGYMLAALKEQKNAVMDLGIAEQEATQILTRFMQAQLDTADAAKLARVAQDAAVIAGMNSSAAAEQMTEAIAKQQPRLLAQFGMMAGLEEMYGDYARSIGKSATELNRMEQKQAMLNYVLSEGEKIAGTYEASMGTVGKKIGSLTRYWDTLKNVIAKPLALPAVGLIVDGITNSLKTAISWAEANQATLQRWGQTAVNTIKKVMGWVGSFARFIAQNWQIISKTTITVIKVILYFKVAAKAITIARTATGLFALTMSVLRGQSVITSGALGALSGALQYYRYQMHLANMAGITSVGVMTKMIIGVKSVGIAIKGLLASIPVVGWIILALGLLVEAGIYVWRNWDQVRHYGVQIWGLMKVGIATQIYGIIALIRLLIGWIPGVGNALSSALSAIRNFVATEAGLIKSRQAAYESAQNPVQETVEDFNNLIDGANDYTDAVKAAAKNLQSFDEIHSLQDAGGLGDFNLDLSGAGLGILDLGDIGSANLIAGLGETEHALDRFWNWLMARAEAGAPTLSKAWEWVTGKAANVGAWLRGTWSTITTKWSEIKTSVITKATEIKENIAARFNEIKTNVATRINEIKTNVATRWSEIKTNIATKINEIKTDISAKWNEIKTNIAARINEIKTNISTKMNEIKTNIATKATEIYNKLVEPFNNAKKRIGEIVDEAKNWGRNLIDNIVKGIKEKIDAVKKAGGAVAEALGRLLGFSSPTKEGPGRTADRWAPNLMEMFARGLNNGIPDIRAAVREASKELSNLNSSPAMRSMLHPAFLAPQQDNYFDDSISSLATIIKDLIAALRGAFPAGAAAAGGGGGDIYVYIGNEQVDAYIHRSQDRRNTRSNGR